MFDTSISLHYIDTLSQIHRAPLLNQMGFFGGFFQPCSLPSPLCPCSSPVFKYSCGLDSIRWYDGFPFVCIGVGTVSLMMVFETITLCTLLVISPRIFAELPKIDCLVRLSAYGLYMCHILFHMALSLSPFDIHGA